MMFEAEVRDTVAERQEEVVMIIMMRPKEAVRLPDKLAVRAAKLVVQLERRFIIARDVKIMRSAGHRPQIHAPEVRPCQHRGIDQLRQWNRFEGDRVTGFAFGLEGASELPIGGQGE